MRDHLTHGPVEERFWAPKPSGLWSALLSPLHHLILRRHHGIAEVYLRGQENLARVNPGDGALICPNHSYTGDGSLMYEVGRQLRRQFHFMAARHVFAGHGGIDGFILQRLGGFSVDREGCDRRAIRTAIELLSSGKWLVIFPEGEIYHLNEKLTPLREGVAFMAVSAQRDLEKANSSNRVWMIPAAIHYEFIEDVMPGLESALRELEHRVMLKGSSSTPLHERMIRYGEVLLTIKEKEKLGRAYDGDGETLPARLGRLQQTLLQRLENEHLGKSNEKQSIPVRVKLLRQQLVNRLCEEAATENQKSVVRDAIADVHLVLQLFSYPGDYIATRPTPERMVETIEKFEEDVYGRVPRPKGRRRATVTFGEPIDVKPFVAGKARTAATELTAKLEQMLQEMLAAPAG